MDFYDAIKFIKSKQYGAASGYMLQVSFKDKIHSLIKRQLNSWIKKVAYALNVSHKDLLNIHIVDDYPLEDIDREAYEEAWEALGFDKLDDTLSLGQEF